MWALIWTSNPKSANIMSNIEWVNHTYTCCDWIVAATDVGSSLLLMLGHTPWASSAVIVGFAGGGITVGDQELRRWQEGLECGEKW